MEEFEQIEKNNDLLVFLDDIVEDDVLQDLINKEESLQKLSCFLKWKCGRISRNISERTDFCIAKILKVKHSKLSNTKATALKYALLAQHTSQELINFLEWFQLKLDNLTQTEESLIEDVVELYYILEVITEIKHKYEDVIANIDKNKLKIFLLKLTEIKLNIAIGVDLPSIFTHYVDEIISSEPDLMDDVLHYLIERENLDFLCTMFSKNLSQLTKANYFQQDELWKFLNTQVNGTNRTKKKQALYILFKTVEYFKQDNLSAVAEILKVEPFKQWDLFFVLLDISEEKQLHLVKPALKLLPSVRNMHVMWQMSVYKVLLGHSQLFIVYKTLEHLMELKFDNENNNQEVLNSIFVALNKYEYSDLSQNSFNKFSVFCTALDENRSTIFFEEFLRIIWNPAAAWSALKSASSILCKVPNNLIQKMLSNLKTLPHTFIKNACVLLFLQQKFQSEVHDIIDNIISIGQILLFSNKEIDEELFYRIVVDNRLKFETEARKLKDRILKSIDDGKEEHVYIYLKIMKILTISLEFNKGIPHSNIGDIILMHFPEHLEHSQVMDYLIDRIQCIGNNDHFYFSKFLYTFADGDDRKSKEITYHDCLQLWKNRNYKDSKMLIVLEVISVASSFTVFQEQMKLIEVEKYLKNSEYIFYKSWIKALRRGLTVSYKDEELSKLIDNFQIILDLDDEEALCVVVENLDLITKYASTEKLLQSVHIYDQCFKKICQSSSTCMKSLFKIFFRSSSHRNMFSCKKFTEYLQSWYTNFFEVNFLQCYISLKALLECFRELIILRAPNVDILIPFILITLRSGAVVHKNQRVEYQVCQDIHNTIGEFSTIPNPNIILMEIKMLVVESLYLISKCNDLENIPSVSDKLIELLLELYNEHYRSRYFPDSKIHFEKLRIVQIFLVLVQFTREAKNLLIEFALNSFCAESHQPSVKLLLQWLLIILLSSDVSKHLNLIVEKLNSANLSQPSSMVALIPVLYHLTISTKETKIWFQVSEALLPWTMGANFKLRVYAQVTLKMLLKKAEEKQLEEYLTKYSLLENCILKVLEASGSAVEEALKSDLVFIESFDPSLHFSIENIFINLPKMLGVASSEWENVREYKFSEEFDMKIKNDHELPTLVKTDSNTEVIEVSGMNLQKKIIPWRCALEENIENKDLGNLICVASLVEKSSNLGGLSRTCEVFCVKQLVLHNAKIRNDKEFQNLSMSSENWVNLMEVKREDLSNFIRAMRQHGYSIIGLEQTSESVKLNDFKFRRKTVLVLGNEKEGIPAPLLPLMDSCVEIPQFGQTRSLNVHVAGATFIWEYVRQYLSQSDK